MALERFNAGEELSARKLNGLVCALNNLCSSARNLQRDQTFSLGNNDRPRRFWDNTVNCGCGCGTTCFTACVCYRGVDNTLPPFAVMRIFTTSELYIKGGFWKYGNAASTAFPVATTSNPVPSFFYFQGRYIFARYDGTFVASCVLCYDHRFYRLLADVCTFSTCVFRVNLCNEVVCVAFPKQYWVGDICQPIPRWSQGGVFKNCTTIEGKLKIYNGMVYVESPLAVAGYRYFCQDRICQLPCTLHIVQGYYPVPCTTLDIPKEDLILMLRYKSCDNAKFDGMAGTFEWYWTCSAKARTLHKCDVPVFGFAQQLTSEFLCQRGCWVGNGSPVNYSYDGAGSWGASIPMGRSYKGAGGVLCARIAQKIPEFRARPIMRFWGARVCLPTCDIHRVSGANCGFVIKNETRLIQSRSQSETRCYEEDFRVPDRIVISYCVCTCSCEGTSFNAVYSPKGKQSISETYYTNGNG